MTHNMSVSGGIFLRRSLQRQYKKLSKVTFGPHHNRFLTTNEIMETQKEEDKNSLKRPNDGKGKYVKSKRSKKEAKENHTWRGIDVNKDERDRDPHVGSFANASLREKFGVSLDPRIIISEDQKTLKRKVALFL